VGWAGVSLGSRSERELFKVTSQTMDVMRAKRFVWWLGDSFEAAIMCGLILRADWTLQVVDEFLAYANQTLKVYLPAAFRLAAIAKAQRGDDRAALRHLMDARKQAKKYNVLYESQLCDFLFYRVFRDESERLYELHGDDSDRFNWVADFKMFGCSENFSEFAMGTVLDWIRTDDGYLQEDRWSKARRSLRLLPSLPVSCFPGSV